MSNKLPEDIGAVVIFLEDFVLSRRSAENKIEWLKYVQQIVEGYISELQSIVDLGAKDDE